MLKTLLVAHDGSDLADRVLPYVADLARRAGGRVVLVRAVEPADQPDDRADEVHRKAAEDARASLSAVAERLRGEGIPVQQKVLSRGSPAAALIEAARSEGADLIAMSTHGRSGIGRWIYGSVADQVLRHTELPVFLIPPGCEDGASTRGAEGGRQIIVPLDGSDRAEAAIGPASDLARALGADILLLQIIEPVTSAYADAYVPLAEPETDLAAARGYLEGVADRLRSTGQTVSTLADLGFAASTIALDAREQGARAIVLATRGRSGLARVVLGSVATGLVHRAGVPLLLVRPTMSGRTVESPASMAEPAAEPATRPITITLSGEDARIVRTGLEELLRNARREQHLAEPMHQLLNRLRDAEARAGVTARV